MLDTFSSVLVEGSAYDIIVQKLWDLWLAQCIVDDGGAKKNFGGSKSYKA